MDVIHKKEKKGGPYTKDERSKRQTEVSRLYFEHGYSATKISEMMNVNRNTINDDIKNIYSNIKNDVGKNIGEFFLRQIGRLEGQRNRIVKRITENNFHNDGNVRYEKILLDIDSKINNLLIGIKTSDDIKLMNNTGDDEIRDFVLYLLVKHRRDYKIDKKKITSEIKNIWQCSANRAEEIFLQMENSGLKYCKLESNFEYYYDLIEFSFLCKFLHPNDSFLVTILEGSKASESYDEQLKRVRKEYSKKYGNNEDRWPDEPIKEFGVKRQEIKVEYNKVSDKAVKEMLENLSGNRPAETYTRYIDVFFGENKVQLKRLSEKLDSQNKE